MMPVVWLLALVLMSSSTPASVSLPAHVVWVDNNFYEPRELEVERGDTVVWSLARGGGHTITAADGSFDFAPSRYVPVSFTFERPGRVLYYCRFHGLPDGSGMSGVIEVDSAAPETA